MGTKSFTYGPFVLWEDDGFVFVDGEDVVLPECDSDMDLEVYVQDAHVQAKLAEVAHKRIAHAEACRAWLDARTGGEGQLDLFPPRSARTDPRPGDRCLEVSDDAAMFEVTRREGDVVEYRRVRSQWPWSEDARVPVEVWARQSGVCTVWFRASDDVVVDHV